MFCPTIRIARSCRPHPSQIERESGHAATDKFSMVAVWPGPSSLREGCGLQNYILYILVGTETASSRLVLRPLCRHGNETILVRLFTLDCKNIRSPFSLSFCQAIHGITVASSQITPIVTCANWRVKKGNRKRSWNLLLLVTRHTNINVESDPSC